jgi:hypothetical protein
MEESERRAAREERATAISDKVATFLGVWVGLLLFIVPLASVVDQFIPDSISSSSDISRSQWQSVANRLEEAGAPYLSVKPYNPDAPGTMRIIIPGPRSEPVSTFVALAFMGRSGRECGTIGTCRRRCSKRRREPITARW